MNSPSATAHQPGAHIRLIASSAVIIAVVFASGCGPSTKEYAHFGQLGTTYETAVDALLVTAVNVKVDADSETLLDLHQQLARRAANANPPPQYTISPKDYEDQANSEISFATVIGRLRRHVALVNRYFELVYSLSTSDQPAALTNSVDGTLKQLNTLGEQLRGRGAEPSTSLLSDDQIKGIDQITGLVVSAVIRGNLREQLKKDNKAILQELTTEDELMQHIANQVRHDEQIADQAREQRIVADPITGLQVFPDDRQGEWLADRRSVRSADTAVVGLDQASNAAAELKSAFVELNSGKLTPTRVNDIVADLDSLLSFAQAVQKIHGGQS